MTSRAAKSLALVAALLSLACAGTPDRTTAVTGPSAVDGTLNQTEDGWRFQPTSGEATPLSVPAEVVTIIEQIVAGEVMPGDATLVLSGDTSDRRIVGWRCVGCAGLPDDAEWVMHGTEPFWGLNLRGDTARWTTPDSDPVTLKVTATPKPGQWTLESADGGSTLTVRIEEATCEDGMADARWHAKAYVERDGFAMQGCAMRGR